MKKALLFEKLDDNFVQCHACSWHCKIAPENTGICGIRLNKNGELYLTVYGWAVGPEIDPIEKKPLFHFLPGTKSLSFGTLGCNFGCLFCQNAWHSQPPRELRAKLTDSENYEGTLLALIKQLSTKISPQEIVDLALKTRCASIAYTYNEPAIFFEYAYDTAKIAKKAGLKNVFVSNGFESEQALNKLKGLLDGINIDIKSFQNEFYQKFSQAKLAPVLANVKRCYQMGVWVEITTLLIPELNDSDSELEQIAQFIYDVSPAIPWHVTAFHPAYKMQARPSTQPKDLLRAYEIGKKVGLKYIYTGNIFDKKHASTYCPQCGELLIRRDWGSLQILNFKEGACGKCKTKIKGIWS
jgi:pyruvate formate lyase activating enzyme